MPGLLSQQAAGSSTKLKYCAHDAETDAKIFQQLVISQQFTEDVLLEHILVFT
jgi:hypothetical protein